VLNENVTHYCQTNCLRLSLDQIHSAVFNGDGHVQTAQDAEAQQRSHMLFPLSDPPRTQVHTFCQRSTSRSEAEQFAAQHYV